MVDYPAEETEILPDWVGYSREEASAIADGWLSICQKQAIAHVVRFKRTAVHLKALQHGTADRDELLAREQALRDRHIADFSSGQLGAVDAQRDPHAARLAVSDE